MEYTNTTRFSGKIFNSFFYDFWNLRVACRIVPEVEIMDDKKKKSGFENLTAKRKRDEEDRREAQNSIMRKFLLGQTPIPNESQSQDEGTSHSAAVSSVTVVESEECQVPDGDSAALVEDVTMEEDIIDEEDVGAVVSVPARWSDVKFWPSKLNQGTIDVLVTRGPTQLIDIEFPLNNSRPPRKFSVKYYTRTISNGESVKRDWLIYSKEMDVVNCFSCCLFKSDETKQLSNWKKGTNDWAHLSRDLKNHEMTPSHFLSYKNWKECEKRLKAGKCIDQDNANTLRIEQNHWEQVFRRVIVLIKYLATQSLAFRGRTEKIFEPGNGNFLKLIEAVAEFDPYLRDHLERISTRGLKTHYLSHKTQNEVISLIAANIRYRILQNIKDNKYFSVIVDCTPDISHTEQMSIIIKCLVLDKATGNYSQEEYFLAFVAIQERTGRGILRYILEEFSKYQLDIHNCRGQGYDNGSNMKGKHIGVQKLMLQEEPRAFFTPCSSHNLNLMVQEAAAASGDNFDFFSKVQEIYNFFSASTKRWDMLIARVPRFTVKNISTTRWASRIDAIKPLRYNLQQIYEALVDIMDDDTNKFDPASKHLARCVADSWNFKFICGVVMWHEILHQVNLVSKLSQEENVDLSAMLKLIANVKQFVQQQRDSGWDNIKLVAKSIAESIDLDGDFPANRRIRRRPRLNDYEGLDESIQDPEQNFVVNSFYFTCDQVINSMDERFKQITEHEMLFGFLYTFEGLSDDDLQSRSEQLQKALSANAIDPPDLDGHELFMELRMLKSMLANEAEPIKTPIKILNYITSTGLANVMPNIVIALRILLTLPMTVASAERSFSKLKLIKTYLRNRMSQERLVDLSIISIEHELAEKLDYNDIVKDFVSAKPRKLYDLISDRK